MIFKSFDTLKDKKEKNFFKEQISVYIRLVDFFCISALFLLLN